MWRKLFAGVVSVGLLGFGVRSAVAEVVFAVETTSGVSAAADQVVVTGKPAPDRTFTSACMNNEGFIGNSSGAHIAVLDTEATPSVSTVDAYFDEELAPGARLVNLSFVVTCTDDGETFNVFTAEVIAAGAGGPSVVATPGGVTLSTDVEAIVKGDGDEDGNADIVCVGIGPAVHTTLWSDLPLLAGDRICDFEKLWTDDDTGETYYFAYVEW